MIYLDYNASVPLRPQAKDAMLAAFEREGNPSSPHGAGRKVRALIDEARKEILDETHADRVVFTSGGTEANALALSGLGSIPVVVSAIEHDSVLKATPNPHIIPVTPEGSIDLEALEKTLDSIEKPGLVSVMLVNNETGVIQPIEKVACITQLKGWKLHTDASQAIGYVPLDFDKLGVDLMTLSSHKCGGPVGIGAILMKDGIHLEPMIKGGGQEYGMRSGTLSAPLILGFIAAFKAALNEKIKDFQQKIETAFPSAIVYGKDSPRAPEVTCLGMPGVLNELQIMAFDIEGIAISAGSACSSGKMKTSHVLAAMGISPEEAKCAIRVSFGWKTQDSDINAFIEAWNRIYDSQKLKDAS